MINRSNINVYRVDRKVYLSKKKFERRELPLYKWDNNIVKWYAQPNANGRSAPSGKYWKTTTANQKRKDTGHQLIST